MRLTRNITSRTSATPRRSAVRVRDVGAAPLNEIGHDVMRTALATGKAVTLTQAITDIARHDDSWWLFDRDSCLRVTDAVLAADLDAFAIRAGR